MKSSDDRTSQTSPSDGRGSWTWLLLVLVAATIGVVVWQFRTAKEELPPTPAEHPTDSVIREQQSRPEKLIADGLQAARRFAIAEKLPGPSTYTKDEYVRELGEMIRSRRNFGYRDADQAARLDASRAKDVLNSSFFNAWVALEGRGTNVRGAMLMNLQPDGSLDANERSELRRTFEENIAGVETLTPVAAFRRYSLDRFNDLDKITQAAGPLIANRFDEDKYPWLDWAASKLDREGLQRARRDLRPWLVCEWCPADVDAYAVITRCTHKLPRALLAWDGLSENVFHDDTGVTNALKSLADEQKSPLPAGMDPHRATVEATYGAIKEFVQHERERASRAKGPAL